MKKFLFLTLLLLYCVYSKSQTILTDDYKKNEIGVNLFSLLPTPVYDLFKFDYSYSLTYLGGIYYKRHVNNIILRVLITYREIHEGPTNIGDWMSERKYNEGILKFGINRQINILNSKTIIPYFGADLLLKLSNFEGFEGGGFTGTYASYKNQSKGIGISPIIGFRINFTKRIAMNIETSVDLMFLDSEINTTVHQHGDQLSNLYSNETEFRNYWNPISMCTISYKF